jgi:hypothetical protein
LIQQPKGNAFSSLANALTKLVLFDRPIQEAHAIIPLDTRLVLKHVLGIGGSLRLRKLPGPCILTRA